MPASIQSPGPPPARAIRSLPQPPQRLCPMPYAARPWVICRYNVGAQRNGRGTAHLAHRLVAPRATDRRAANGGTAARRQPQPSPPAPAPPHPFSLSPPLLALASALARSPHFHPHLPLHFHPHPHLRLPSYVRPLSLTRCCLTKNSASATAAWWSAAAMSPLPCEATDPDRGPLSSLGTISCLFVFKKRKSNRISTPSYSSAPAAIPSACTLLSVRYPYGGGAR